MDKLTDQVFQDVLSTLKKHSLFRYYGNQDESPSRLLEKAFCEYYKMKFSLVVNSCSSAIFLSLIVAGVKPRDKVLLPAFTFIAVPSAIVNVGALPVLVEVISK